MIKKSDCIASLDKKDEDDLKSFSAIIDERLKKYHRGSIHIDIPTGVSDKVVQRIIGDYSAQGGWTVEEGSSQKDGSWLTFS